MSVVLQSVRGRESQPRVNGQCTRVQAESAGVVARSVVSRSWLWRVVGSNVDFAVGQRECAIFDNFTVNVDSPPERSGLSGIFNGHLDILFDCRLDGFPLQD